MKGIKTIIHYSSTNGLTCADGDAVDMARNIMGLGRRCVTVSTGLIIDAIRVMLSTGEISVDEVEFHFDGHVLKHGADGRISDWPHGFNDTMEGLLMQLL